MTDSGLVSSAWKTVEEPPFDKTKLYAVELNGSNEDYGNGTFILIRYEKKDKCWVESVSGDTIELGHIKRYLKLPL